MNNFPSRFYSANYLDPKDCLDEVILCRVTTGTTAKYLKPDFFVDVKVKACKLHS